MERRHVVLVTYGEPSTASFLDQLVYSWRILLGLTRKVDAIPRPVLPLIALARARGRRHLWRQHDYGSPLEAITERQSRAVAAILSSLAPGIDWRVHVAYEYRHPLVSDAVDRLPLDDPVWVVPLYAADSAFTHQLTREASEGRAGPTCVLGALAPELLGHASASHVLSHTGRHPGWQGDDVALVLAAHGTVLEPPKPIDTGREATEALCADISARVRQRFGMVVNGWLNHTRGGRWTEPAIGDALARVEAAGYRRVVYFPYGFLGDNAESQLEGRVALAQTSLEALHLPCLNDASALMELLSRQVLRCAGACLPNRVLTVAQPGDARDCGRLCQPSDAGIGACDICATRSAVADTAEAAGIGSQAAAL